MSSNLGCLGNIKHLLKNRFRKKLARLRFKSSFLKNDKCANKPNCKTENETQQNWKKREPESDSHHDCRSAESWKIGTGCPAFDQQIYRVRNLLFHLQDFNPILNF